MSSRPRPSTHFAPVANWMNDPNGLIFWKGRYHLFYQHNPIGTAPAPAKICWGHADSADLVHWRDLPLALEPTPGSVDEDGCWSGRAVAHDGEVYLLYTGIRDGQQRPCLAKALDDTLVSFEKLDANPVISEEPLPGLVGFRDHAVREADGEIRQLIGSGSRALGGCLLEYRSKDLLSWDYCGVFVSARSAGFPGDMWECPDLFRLGDQWFIVVSVLQHGEPGGVMSIAGFIERETFLPRLTARTDTGSRWYAPQSFDAPDGRRICFGWLREREDALPEPDRGRVGVMSLPRELFGAPDGSLGMAPAAELASLRAGPIPARVDGETGAVRLDPGKGLDAFELEATYSGHGAVLFDLLDEQGDLVVEVGVGQDRIEMSRSALLPIPPAPTAGTVRLFYDGGICEVFSAAGRVRSEIFYRCPPVSSIAVRGQQPGTAVVVEMVRAWELASIW
jgi:beta-fructofuranosidase